MSYKKILDTSGRLDAKTCHAVYSDSTTQTSASATAAYPSTILTVKKISK